MKPYVVLWAVPWFAITSVMCASMAMYVYNDGDRGFALFFAGLAVLRAFLAFGTYLFWRDQ